MSALTDPKTFRDTRRRKYEDDVRALRAKYRAKKKAVQDSAQAEMHSIDKLISHKNRISVSDWSFDGFLIGVILSIAGCSLAGISAEGWFGTVAVCTVIGAIAALPAKNTKALESNRLSIESKMCEDMAKLDSDCDEIIKYATAKCHDEIAENHIQFEKAQRECSVAFIGSAVTKEITDYMLEPLLKTIRSYDRRSHIKEINVPFSFEVYPNKVMSSYGTYDFIIKRVQLLKSVKGQAALAYAIATAIHTEIITTFKVDPSGGEVFPMDIDYQYDTNYHEHEHANYHEYTNYVKVSMTYRAANGNFVEARSF